MLRKLAIAISIMMHPLLMTTLLLAVLFYFAPVITKPIGQAAALYIISAVFITTFVLPMISMVALRLSAIMGGSKRAAFSLPAKEDRVLPFFFTGVFYAITAYMFFAKLRVNQVLVVILIAVTLIILLISLVTLVMKVSAYAASAGSLAGFLIVLGEKYPQEYILWPLVVVLILGGLAMSARLYLNEHTPFEVLTGYAIGLVVSLTAILLFVA